MVARTLIDLRGILIQLVVPKFFSLHIIIADAREIEQARHRSDHSGWACDVVDRSIESEQIACKHLAIEVTFFVWPSQSFMSSDRWNEGEIRILHGHAFKFFDERGIVRFPV